ncbi:MAG: GDP-mannose 4,6-dehydratase [Opitutaceae bacterium]|nr:GDP-mannose 4,6-dehydratase [Cytophagales bacterium]
MKSIIFGANGQDGYYLNELLRSKNVEVIGISRSGNWLVGDVNNPDLVAKIIKSEKPDYIFNFAANSTTRHDVLIENHNTILGGTLNILEAVKNHSPASKVFLSGSGLQFENKGTPIKETDHFEASSAYSMSRIQSVYAARYYRIFGLRTYVGYFFNHESPRRTERHISKMVSEACKRIKKGSKEKITLGDISVQKEWTYAGDSVEAIWTLVNQENELECVIGSGVTYSIEKWLELCFMYYDMDWKDHFSPKEHYKPDYSILVSDPNTINQLGWKPNIDFYNLAEIMMEQV